MEKNQKVIKAAAAAGICVAIIVAVIMMIPQKSPEPETMAAVTTAPVTEEVTSEKETDPLETIDWEALLETEDDTVHMLAEYEEKKAEIPDLVGWLHIDGTGIDYPVVQKNNEFYMNHDAYGQDDVYGAIFLEQVNNLEKPDNNLLIYGHNRKDEKMFGELMEYKSEDYYQEHPIIQFDTLYEKGEYEIISVFLSKVYYTTDTDFKYYQFFGSDNPEQFQDYVDHVKEMSLYPIDATASYGDELITLSTCEYSVQNGRMAIVARKVKTE